MSWVVVEGDAPVIFCGFVQDFCFAAHRFVREHVVAEARSGVGVVDGWAGVAEEEDCFLCALHEDGLVAPGMPGAREKFEPCEWCALAVVEFELALDRIEVRSEVRLRHRALVGECVDPLLPLHMNARVCEHAGEVVAFKTRQASGVIEVQVCEEDMRDIFGRDAVFSECIDRGARREFVDRAIFRGPLVAVACFDKDEPVRRMHEERACGERDAVLLIGLRPLRPHGFRNEPEHPATIEAKPAGQEWNDA